MTDTSTPMKFIIGFGAILAIGIPTFVVGQYVSDLRHDMEASKVEVERLKGQITSLQDILQKSQNSSSGVQGPKGDRGEKGEPGEVGPQGARGERGLPGDKATDETVSSGDVQAMVDLAVEKKLSTLPAVSSSPMQASIAKTLEIFDIKGCIPIGSLKGIELITFRAKQEFCDKNGKLLFRIDEIMPDATIHFVNPGKRDGYCYLEKQCELSNIGNFIYERKAESDEGTVALLRLQ